MKCSLSIRGGRTSGLLLGSVLLSGLLVLPGSPAVAATNLPSAPGASYQANGRVAAIVTVGNVVYLGGSFTSLRPAGAPAGTGEVARNHLAAVNRDTGALLAWNPNADKRRLRPRRLPGRRDHLCRRPVRQGRRSQAHPGRGDQREHGSGHGVGAVDGRQGLRAGGRRRPVSTSAGPSRRSTVRTARAWRRSSTSGTLDAGVAPRPRRHRACDGDRHRRLGARRWGVLRRRRHRSQPAPRASRPGHGCAAAVELDARLRRLGDRPDEHPDLPGRQRRRRAPGGPLRQRRAARSGRSRPTAASRPSPW